MRKIKKIPLKTTATRFIKWLQQIYNKLLLIWYMKTRNAQSFSYFIKSNNVPQHFLFVQEFQYSRDIFLGRSFQEMHAITRKSTHTHKRIDNKCDKSHICAIQTFGNTFLPLTWPVLFDQDICAHHHITTYTDSCWC